MRYSMDARVVILLLCGSVVLEATNQVKTKLEEKCDNVNDDATCTIDGINVKTFDGKHFTYTTCDHILAQNYCHNKWRIIERKICTVSPASASLSRTNEYQRNECLKQLEITQNGEVLTITSNLDIEYKDFTYNVAQAHAIGSLRQEFVMSYNGRSVFFKSLLYGFWLHFDHVGNTKIGAPDELMNKINGLCGKFNKIPEDDTTKPNGEHTAVAHEFGDSWRTPGSNLWCREVTCPDAIRRIAFDICSNITSSHPLSQCIDVVDVDFCINKCVRDFCYCSAHRSGCKCEVTQKFMQHCQAQDKDLDLSSWRDINMCTMSCPPGMIYQDCNKRICEPSCENVHNPNACPMEEDSCHAGCFCPENLVRKGNTCVRPDQCKDCVCSGWGDPHYTTFDGTTYDFQGECTYIASTGTPADNSSRSSYKVLVTNVPCGPNSVSCTSGVTVVYNLVQNNFSQEMVVSVNRADTVGKNLVTQVNSGEVTSFPYQGGWLTMESHQDHHVTIYIAEAQLEVTYYYYSWSFVVRLSSQVYAPESLKGLCGNCNKDRYDDLTHRNGHLVTDVTDFGNSWLAQETDLPYGMTNGKHCGMSDPPSLTCLPGYPVPAEEDRCLHILNNDKFGMCHPLVDPAPYVKACQYDLCHSDQREGALCSAVHAYAKACQIQGVCLDWRSDDFCPYNCPAGKVYLSCGLGCEVTCNNYLQYLQNPASCTIEPNEGCFCPDGLISKGNRCVNAEGCKDCTCTAWGDPHFRNFDNSYFAFQGNCTYVASRDLGNNHLFQVWVTNKASPSCGTAMTCPVGIVIFYRDQVIHLHSDENNWRIVTEIDGRVINELPIHTTNLMVQSTFNHYRVTVYIPEIQLEAALQRNYFSLRLPSLQYANSTEGLCGTCNSNRSDDFVTSEGFINTNVTEFALSWLVKEGLIEGLTYDENCGVIPPPNQCQAGYPLPQDQNPCLWILDQTKFGQCHEVIDPLPFVNACEYDMCHSSDRDTIRCNSAETYADQCRGKGICLDWRSPDVCPFTCPLGTEYRSCGSGCIEDCDNYMMYRRNPNLCGLETTEGCFCPQGEVFKHGQCIKEEECEEECNLNRDLCQVVGVPASAFARFTVVDPVHGNCTNKFRLPPFTMCRGVCDTKPVFDFDTVQGEAECCDATMYNVTSIVMRCQDGTEYSKSIKFPSACACSGCNCERPTPSIPWENTSPLPTTPRVLERSQVDDSTTIRVPQ